MDQRVDLHTFLAARRARVTPEQAGLPSSGTHRRVSGLRRAEVATLAGVSVEWYTRLERGQASGVSDSVLTSLARALQLDDAETAHLFDLARTVRGSAQPAGRSASPQVRPSVRRILDSMSTVPAILRVANLDILAINALGRALYAPVWQDPTRPLNLARLCFLDPIAHDFYPDWDEAATNTVAILRTEAGRAPDDPAVAAVIDELTARSEDFRRRWPAHHVRRHRSGIKLFRHPLVGDLSLVFDAMELPADPGQTITAYSAEPGSPDAEKLRLLALWASRGPT